MSTYTTVGYRFEILHMYGIEISTRVSYRKKKLVSLQAYALLIFYEGMRVFKY